MKLFLIHCGFYDAELGGLYESHTNFFVTAAGFDEARLKAKEIPQFRDKRMHVDGLQEVAAVDGFRIQLNEDKGLDGASVILSHKHRDLAPPSKS